MLDSRHINEIASRQSNMRRDPGSLSGNGFLRDLYKNFLTFAKQVRYRRLRRAVASVTAVSAIAAVVSASVSALIASASAIASALFLSLHGFCDRRFKFRFDNLVFFKSAFRVLRSLGTPIAFFRLASTSASPASPAT